jgi:hypothetical protein
MTDRQDRRLGGCACGAVRYALGGAPRWAAHCHCRDCRRVAGAPYVTYVGVLKPQLTWSGAAPLRYLSSPGVARSFCGACGTPLAYEGARWPDEVHILAATLDDPSQITPQAHVYVGQKLPWVHLGDGLPRYRTVSSEGPPMAD